MKLRVHEDQRLKGPPLSQAEEYLLQLQLFRKHGLGHMPEHKTKSVQELFEKLERDFIVLCDGLEEISRGDKAILIRALRMYIAFYQQAMGQEKAPAHKQDLKGYITAAETLFNKLFGHAPRGAT